MNCWFCNNSFSTFQESKKYCGSNLCKNKKVTYYFNYNLFCVQFIIPSKITGFQYLIDYSINQKNMEVFLIGKSTLTSKSVLILPYDSPILTPQNVESKLPLLLTFS